MHFAVLCIILTASASVCESSKTPEQIHLSFGDADAKSIVVTWSTKELVNFAAVEYLSNTTNEKSVTVNATVEEFIDGGQAKSKQYIYRAWLKDLSPGTTYLYRCGGLEDTWSEVLTFRMAGGNDRPFRVAVFADLGFENAAIVPALTAQVQNDIYSAILNAGDSGYDLADENGTLGDNFTNMIQPFASRAPLMLCPGNHESEYNFSHFEARFSMLQRETRNHYYSFNLGNAHFVSISTEFYFFPQYYPLDVIQQQFDWLERDLKNANLNRNERPWIILYGHRPLYCSLLINDGSNKLDKDCNARADYLRNGNSTIPYGLDKLLFDYKVDVAIWGHVHYYERTWPVYNNAVYKSGSGGGDWSENAAATVHIVNGAGGNKYGLENYTQSQDYSAAGANQNGYGSITYNATHLFFDQYAVNGSAVTVIDSFTLKKTQNGTVIDSTTTTTTTTPGTTQGPVTTNTTSSGNNNRAANLSSILATIFLFVAIARPSYS